MLCLRVMVSFYSKHCGSWKSRKNREFPDNREDKYLLDPTEKVCFKCTNNVNFLPPQSHELSKMTSMPRFSANPGELRAKNQKGDENIPF